MLPIYKQEISDGLLDHFKERSCVAYCCNIEPEKSFEVSDLVLASARNLIKAENQNQIDLYYFKSLLVSTGWNFNEDVFDRKEVWAARKSPEDKPFNYEHDCLDILGHHTSNITVDASFNLLSDDLSIDELPNKFHIITRAVIYKLYDDIERQEKINKILAEIPRGLWFVSMEAWFKDFDYALINVKSNEQKVVARNEKTSHLSKHLKAMGGSGVYQDYRIGRLLRGITFAGAGLVKNPANPESIIFKDIESVKSFKVENDSVYLSLNEIKSEKKMSNEIKLDEFLKTIKEKDDKISELEKALSENSVKASKVKVEDLTKELSVANAKADEFEKKYNELLPLSNSNAAEVVSIKKQLDEANSKYDEVNKSLLAIQADVKKNTRIALVKSVYNVDEKEAEEIVASLGNISDESFSKNIELNKKFVGAKKVETPEPEKKDLEKILDNAKAKESADLVTGGAPDKTAELMKQIRACVYAENK